MTAHEVMLGDLVGRRIRDDDGRVVGRVLELAAEIALREDGRDYVISAYHVTSFGALDVLAGMRFTQQLLELLGARVGCRRYVVPWDAVDIENARRPRLTRRLDPTWRQDL